MAATFSGALRLFTVFSVLLVLNAAQDSYNYHSRRVDWKVLGFSKIFYPSLLCLNLGVVGRPWPNLSCSTGEVHHARYHYRHGRQVTTGSRDRRESRRSE